MMIFLLLRSREEEKYQEEEDQEEEAQTYIVLSYSRVAENKERLKALLGVRVFAARVVLRHVRWFDVTFSAFVSFLIETRRAALLQKRTHSSHARKKRRAVASGASHRRREREVKRVSRSDTT